MGAAAQLCLVTSAGLGWIDVAVEKVAGGAYDVAATDGTGLAARGVPRRRLRQAGASMPALAAGMDVDVVRDGGLRPGTIAAVVAGGVDVTLADGARLSAVPAHLVLALHA